MKEVRTACLLSCASLSLPTSPPLPLSPSLQRSVASRLFTPRDELKLEHLGARLCSPVHTSAPRFSPPARPPLIFNACGPCVCGSNTLQTGGCPTGLPPAGCGLPVTMRMHHAHAHTHTHTFSLCSIMQDCSRRVKQPVFAL